jgi:hypothetical protein
VHHDVISIRIGLDCRMWAIHTQVGIGSRLGRAASARRVQEIPKGHSSGGEGRAGELVLSLMRPALLVCIEMDADWYEVRATGW